MKKLRAQLLAIGIQAYRRTMRQIRQNLGSQANRGVTKYAREYNTHVRSFSRISSKAELVESILSSNIVFHGDYHPLKQSQRSILRVLREIGSKRPVVLCLEMFYAVDQLYVDQFMAGKIPEKEFLKNIDYEKKWGFRWEHWVPIFELCRAHGILVVGINADFEGKSDALRRRDSFAARIITRTFLKNSDALVYVVCGDYHIAPVHLPAKVERLLSLLDAQAVITIVYQNVEALYWKLAQRGREESDVVRIDKRSFCIINTTPLNKVQSYLNWIEYSNEAFYPEPSAWRDDNIETVGDKTISDLVKTICTFLGLEFPREHLDRLEIYYIPSAGMFRMIKKNATSPAIVASIKERIRRNAGFFFRYRGAAHDSYLMYLPNSSINLAAEEASHFINAACGGIPGDSLRPFDAFYRTVITECLGFFGSKIINERRTPPTISALRTFVSDTKKKIFPHRDRIELYVARLLMQHRACDRRAFVSAQPYQQKFDGVYASRTQIPVVFATQLGYMLGNRLYYALKNEQITIPDVSSLFLEKFDGDAESFGLYRRLDEILP